MFITKLYQGDLSDYLRVHTVSIDLETKLRGLIEKLLDIGIICVDQKPENILLNWNESGLISEIVLTDFGRDWCCLSKIRGNCDYLTGISDFLTIGDNKLFIKLIILFSLSYTSLKYYHRQIFVHDMRILLYFIRNRGFINFFRIICNGDLSTCQSIYPPFYYFIRGEKITVSRSSNILVNIEIFLRKFISEK